MKRKKSPKNPQLEMNQQILNVLRKVKILEARILFLEEENINLKKIVENSQINPE